MLMSKKSARLQSPPASSRQSRDGQPKLSGANTFHVAKFASRDGLPPETAPLHSYPLVVSGGFPAEQVKGGSNLQILSLPPSPSV